MSNEIRTVDPNAAATPKKGILDWLPWFLSNKDKLWQLVMLIAALFGGATVGAYRQELTDLAVESMPVSSQFADLEHRVTVLEAAVCPCATDGDEVDGVVRVQ